MLTGCDSVASTTGTCMILLWQPTSLIARVYRAYRQQRQDTLDDCMHTYAQPAAGTGV